MFGFRTLKNATLRLGFRRHVCASSLTSSALSYDHFSETRHWTQKHDLSHIADEKARTQARYKLADDYRQALLGEPMKLIENFTFGFTSVAPAMNAFIRRFTSGIG